MAIVTYTNEGFVLRFPNIFIHSLSVRGTLFSLLPQENKIESLRPQSFKEC